MQLKLFAILISTGILFFVFEMIRRKKISFRYSFFWLSVCVLILTLSYCDSILIALSSFFGFELPSNFFFFLVMVFFITLSLSMTIYINEQNSRTETLAQLVGILELELDELKEKLNIFLDSTD